MSDVRFGSSVGLDAVTYTSSGDVITFENGIVTNFDPYAIVTITGTMSLYDGTQMVFSNGLCFGTP